MISYEQFGITKEMTREEGLEHLGKFKKKLIVRMNSADVNKRRMAEDQNKIIGFLMNMLSLPLDNCFKAWHIVEAIEVLLADNKTEVQIEEFLRCPLKANPEEVVGMYTYLTNKKRKISKVWVYYAAMLGLVKTEVYTLAIMYCMEERNVEDVILWNYKAMEQHVLTAEGLQLYAQFLKRVWSEEEAIYEIEEAVKRCGNAALIYAVGELYESGKEFPRDLKKALDFYEEAKNKGYSAAETKINKLTYNPSAYDYSKLNTKKNSDKEQKNKKFYIGLGIFVVIVGILFMKDKDGVGLSTEVADEIEESFVVEEQLTQNEPVEKNYYPISELWTNCSQEEPYRARTYMDTTGTAYTYNSNCGVLNVGNYLIFSREEGFNYLSGTVAVKNDSSDMQRVKLCIYEKTGNYGEWILTYETEEFSKYTEPFAIDYQMLTSEVKLEIKCVDDTQYSGDFHVLLIDFEVRKEWKETFSQERTFKKTEELVAIQKVEANGLQAPSNAKDTIGNIYYTSNVKQLIADKDVNGYAEYYLGGQYSKFVGAFVPQVDSSTVRRGVFQIFVYDDEWYQIYESDEISRMTTPVEFEVNIEGAKWIRLVYKRTDDEWNDGVGNLLLTDCVFCTDESYEELMQERAWGEESSKNIVVENQRLCDATILQCLNYNKVQNVEKDTMGYTYTGENVYTLASDVFDNGFVEYYLGGSYQYVSGVVAVNNGNAINRTGKFQIFTKNNADDEWKSVYETREFKRAFIPEAFCVDVSEAVWIRFQYTVTSGSLINAVEGKIILSDIEWGNEIRTLDIPKIEMAEKEKLSKMVIPESTGFTVEAEAQKDFAGNKYMGSNICTLYANQKDEGIVYCYTDCNYDMISGKFVRKDDCYGNCSSSLRIDVKRNGEWITVYTSPLVGNNDEPIEFSANIEDAQWVRIVHQSVSSSILVNLSDGILIDTEFY